MNNNVILLEYRMVLMDEMIHEINHILNCGYGFKPSYYLCSYESNFRNCVGKSERNFSGFSTQLLKLRS